MIYFMRGLLFFLYVSFSFFVLGCNEDIVSDSKKIKPSLTRKELKEFKRNLDTFSTEEKTARFYECVLRDDLFLAKEYFHSGILINEDYSGRQFMRILIEKSAQDENYHNFLLEIILEQQNVLSMETEIDNSPLTQITFFDYLFYEYNEIDKLDEILNIVENVNILDSNGRNAPLAFALGPYKTIDDKEEKLELLIKYGIDLSVICSTSKNNFLNVAPSFLMDLEVTKKNMKIAIEQGADVNNPDQDGNTPLHDAVAAFGYMGYKTDIIELLLNNGADKSTETIFGTTPYDETSPLDAMADDVYSDEKDRIAAIISLYKIRKLLKTPNGKYTYQES